MIVGVVVEVVVVVLVGREPSHAQETSEPWQRGIGSQNLHEEVFPKWREHASFPAKQNEARTNLESAVKMNTDMNRIRERICLSIKIDLECMERRKIS